MNKNKIINWIAFHIMAFYMDEDPEKVKDEWKNVKKWEKRVYIKLATQIYNRIIEEQNG